MWERKDDKELIQKADKVIFPGIQGGPLMHVIAAKAVSFKEALSPEYKEYQTQVVKNAKALADGLKAKGFDGVGMCEDVYFITSQELLDMYPGTTDKQREYLIMKYFEKIRELGLDDLGVFSINN